MSETSQAPEAQARPHYIIYVWVDADWKARYRAASAEERVQMRRQGVKIHYRHKPATDELLAQSHRREPMSAEEFLGA